ncbi:hypothetical protein, partial [Pseudomonas sp. NPDC089396]|uniref:hypothetical protein n=1 Tax=Pseudomonas sp. NPDC089396 TaxID=3364461 RepID=UPI00383572A4
FYGFTSLCQAFTSKKPFSFKRLALAHDPQLRRGGAFRPIIVVGCEPWGCMRYYLYEFTVLTVVHVFAKDHSYRLRLLLRRHRDA